MLENWQKIPEFPNYAVSNLGNILSINRDVVLVTGFNQQGIRFARFYDHNRQIVRSVAKLVADAFLEPPERPEVFDTPIHLNGDHADCRAENLAWRPRWFAVKYHRQFSDWEREHRRGFICPVRINETGEMFPTSWEAAIKYGMIDRDIFIQTVNQHPTFPHGFTFSEVDL